MIVVVSVSTRRNPDVQAYTTLMCQQRNVIDTWRKVCGGRGVWLCAALGCCHSNKQKSLSLQLITISSVTWAGTQSGALCSPALPPQYTRTCAVETCRVLQPIDNNRKAEIHTNQLHSNGNSHNKPTRQPLRPARSSGNIHTVAGTTGRKPQQDTLLGTQHVDI